MSQISSHYRQLIIATLSPTKFNSYILTFDIAKFTQAFAELLQAPCDCVGRSVVEETDHGLCARAASGHAAAAPPTSVMNSRRLIRSPCRRAREAMQAL